MEKTPLQKVTDLFIEYFGEEKVDLQINKILVYYPSVTIANENDRSAELTELYVKIEVSNDGLLLGTFRINRSEYTAAQWVSDYMHSHVCGIPKNTPNTFLSPCLGYGPIRDTCLSLNREFDEDIWRLFIYELDKYIHTESLSGGPYRKIENIGISNNSSSYIETVLIPEVWDFTIVYELESLLYNEFLPYLIHKGIFSFNYNGKYYDIADSPLNIVIKTSNVFIEWYNSLPDQSKVNWVNIMFANGNLIRCKTLNGGLYTRKVHRRNLDLDNINLRIGTPLWEFKGNIVYRNITNIPNSTETADPMMEEFLRNSAILLDPRIVSKLINRIVNVINFKYGRAETTPGEETFYL